MNASSVISYAKSKNSGLERQDLLLTAILAVSASYMLWLAEHLTHGPIPVNLFSSVSVLAVTWVILNIMARSTFGSDIVSQRWFIALSILIMMIAISIAVLWFAPTTTQNLDLDGFYGGADKERYERYAWLVVQQGFGILDKLPLNDLGVVLTVAMLYTLVGRSVLAVAAAQVLFHAWVSTGLYNIVKRVDNKNSARLAMILWMVLPLPVFYASFPGKDVPVAALMLATVNTLAHLNEKGKGNIKRLLITLWLSVLVATLALFRTNMILALAVSLVTIITFQKRRLASPFTSLAVAGAIVGGIALLWSLMGRDFQYSTSKLFQTVGDIESVLSQARFGADESSFSLRLYWDGNWNKAYLIAVRLPFSIWFPFPPRTFDTWQTALPNINAWLLIVLAPAVATAIEKTCCQRESQRSLIELWLPALVIATALSAGTPIMQPRYAIPAYPYVVGMAALGFNCRQKLRRWYLLIVELLGMAFIGYTVLK